MDDNERDRCSDDAGPATADDAGPNRRKSHHVFLYYCILFIFCGLSHSNAQTGNGLSANINVGVLRPDNVAALFYSGIPTNDNTIARVLNSESYGYPIWIALTNQDLITSAISDYSQLSVAEYGKTTYKTAIQLGLGLRYQYDHGWAWLLRFDYSKLNAIGAFLLNSGRNSPGIITNQDAYISCPIAGQEERIYIDFGVSKKFRLQNGLDLSIDLGASLNNTKVKSNDILIAGQTYSILDIWNGQSPSSYVGSYEYLNQGGVGGGGFSTLGLGLELPNYNAITLYYSFYYTHITLSQYSGFFPQSLFGLRFDLGSFNLFASN